MQLCLQKGPQNLLFCHYLYPKKKRKKNTIKNFGFSSLTQNCTWPELEQMEYTLAYRGIPWPTGLSRSRSRFLSQPRSWYLSQSWSFSQIDLNFSQIGCNLGLPLKIPYWPKLLSFSPNFLIRSIVSHHVFGFDFKGRETMLFPLNFFLITIFF